MSTTPVSRITTATPFGWMETAFRNVCGGSRGLRLDVDAFGDHRLLPGWADRDGPLGLVELRQLFLDSSASAYPLIAAVWAELVRRAQPPADASDPVAAGRGIWEAWQVGCVGMALPALKGMYRRLAAGRAPGEVEADVQAALVAGLVSRLRRIDPDTPRLPSPLLWSAWRSGLQVASDARAWAQEAGVGLAEVAGSAAPPAPAGHPDLVLAHAVTGGLLTQAEAGLISETRLGGRSLVEVAAQLGVTANAVGLRRRKAETRLVAAIGDGSLTRHGYWPPTPARPQPPATRPTSTPVAAAGVRSEPGNPAGKQLGPARGGDGKQGAVLAEDDGKQPPQGGDSRSELGGKEPAPVSGVPHCRLTTPLSVPGGVRPAGVDRGVPEWALTPPAHHPGEGGPPTTAAHPTGHSAHPDPEEATAMHPPRTTGHTTTVRDPAVPRQALTHRTDPRPRLRPTRPVLVVTIAVLVLLATATAAFADPGGAGHVVAAPASLAEVISRLRTLIVGLLVALATLYATIGGVRYVSAGGDPGQVAKAREAFKNAAYGYALAALAPLLVGVLQQIVA